MPISVAADLKLVTNNDVRAGSPTHPTDKYMQPYMSAREGRPGGSCKPCCERLNLSTSKVPDVVDVPSL